LNYIGTYRENVSIETLSYSYKYGFQNQEEDNEVYGSKGTFVNYKYRGADTRIGRFFAVDPLTASYPWNSPYAFSENTVIDHIELEGLEKIRHGADASGVQEYGDVEVPMTDAVSSPITNGMYSYYGHMANGELKYWEVRKVYSDATYRPDYIVGPNDFFKFYKNQGDYASTANMNAWANYYETNYGNTSMIEGWLSIWADPYSYSLGGKVSKVKPKMKPPKMKSGSPRLPDNAKVVRGGTNTPDRFDKGSGVSSRLSDGHLDGISVNSTATGTEASLSKGIRNGKVGTTTVGEVRAKGGDVVPSPTRNNPNHATMSIPNSKAASELMKVKKNPAGG
jgi:hypothetical protein